MHSVAQCTVCKKVCKFSLGFFSLRRTQKIKEIITVHHNVWVEHHTRWHRNRPRGRGSRRFRPGSACRPRPHRTCRSSARPHRSRFQCCRARAKSRSVSPLKMQLSQVVPALTQKRSSSPVRKPSLFLSYSSLNLSVSKSLKSSSTEFG